MSILAAGDIKGRFLPGIKVGSSDLDTAIEAVVDRADALIAQACGFHMIAASKYTLASSSYDVYMPRPRGRKLYLPALPVTAISQIDEMIGDDTTLIDSTYYEVRGGRNLVYRKIGVWNESRKPNRDPELRVQFTAGFSTLVGHPLFDAVGLQTAHMWLAPKTQGKTNIAGAGGGKSVGLRDEVGLAPAVKQIISGYRVGFF